MKFLKNRKSDQTTTVVTYSPLECSNILRFAHVTQIVKEKQGEEEVEVQKEFLIIEYNLVAEQDKVTPLKAMKRVKQTKNEEYFYVEEVVKMIQPLMDRIEDKEQISKILAELEKNSI